MPLVTVARVLKFRPCERYTEERLVDLLGDGLPFAACLQLEEVPIDDRVWLACAWLARYDRALLFAWLDGAVERAIRNHCINCGIAAIEKWAGRWLDGDKAAREAAAGCAAVDAAWAAAADAAYDAADAAEAARAEAAADAAYAAATARAAYAADAADAARAAARAAAYAAAEAAARAAYAAYDVVDAVRAAARAAERRWQLGHLLYLMIE